MENTKKIIGLFLLIFVIILSFSILILQRKRGIQKLAKPSLTSSIESSSLSPTVEVKKINLPQSFNGQLILEKENNLPIKSNQNFNLILKANIPNEDIVGFDVVFSFDQQSLDFISAQSLIKDFTLIPIKKENYLRLTMVKKPEANQPTFFKQTAVIMLTFKAKKTGVSTIKILPQIDKEKTQFINNKTEIVYPKTDEININILE